MFRWHDRTPLRFAAVATFAVAATPLAAQVTEVARSSVASVAQLTFGNFCEDRFVLRNDGTEPVSVEFAVAKATERTRLTLNGREQVEVTSQSKEALELWMDGKLIAKAEKERRSCRDVAGNASVVVAPLEVATTNRDDRARNNRMGAYPFYDPFYYGYAGFYNGWGFRPFYSGFYGVPIIIGGGRGGRRR